MEDTSSTLSEDQVSDTEQSVCKETISPDDILDFIGFGLFQAIAFVLIGSSFCIFGCNQAVYNFIGDSLRVEWNITTTQYAILPAFTAPPSIIGAAFFGILSDRFGRWWPYALCLGWFFIAALSSAFANSFPVLIALRCGLSLAMGGVSGFVYSTLVEFLPIKSRGSVTVLLMLMYALGMCLSCGLAWWLIPTYPVHGWRYYIFACGIPTLFIFLFRLLFPFESPRYLISNGKFLKAWKVFNTIARLNGKRLSDFITPDAFTCDFASKKQHCNAEESRIFLKVLYLMHPKYLKWTIPLCILTTTQTFGYQSSSIFLKDFLKRVDVHEYFTLLAVSVAQLPGIVFLSIIVEWPRVGRLNSFRFFSGLAAFFFLLLTLIQTSISIPLFLIFIFFSSAATQGVLFTYIAEVFPTGIRSVAVSYFYILSEVTYLSGSFGASKVANMSQQWAFPAVFTVVFSAQFFVSFVLNYEPEGKTLKDAVK